ncbi:MAG: hypothetical protein JXR64_12460 [Spirochaetales bacterium]|nr:hypothetical protein [Spirochaetales bacterium]
MKKVFLLIIQVLTFSSLIFSESLDSITWEKNINWEDNNIEIIIKAPLTQNNSTLAATRRKAENLITDNKTNIFFKNILDLQINSRETLSEIIDKDPDIYFKLDRLGESLQPSNSILSTNLEYMSISYILNLYPDLISVFYTQSQYLKKYKKLDHRTYGDFTGLIIYVPDNLPLHGKNSTGNLNKVLLPRIFDEDMNLIMDFTMIEPEFIKKWGVLIYGNSYDENKYLSRIGITPLRIVARGIFGKNNSDIIISNSDADKIIGSEDNLKIISQARILILN